ncbi:hypothetical protein Tco_1078176 [Tanacetum coccineum]
MPPDTMHRPRSSVVRDTLAMSHQDEVERVERACRRGGRNATKGNDRRGCTYKEFLACNPKEYDGKAERVKYTAVSFVVKALTWWNSEIHTRGREAVVGMSWEDFRTLIREEFYPSNEMQKL